MAELEELEIVQLGNGISVLKKNGKSLIMHIDNIQNVINIGSKAGGVKQFKFDNLAGLLAFVDVNLLIGE